MADAALSQPGRARKAGRSNDFGTPELASANPPCSGWASYWFIKSVLRYDEAKAFGTGALLGVLGLATQVMIGAFQVAWRTVSVPAIASPEEFELIFGEILKDVLSKQSES